MSYDLNCYVTPSHKPMPTTLEGKGWQLAVYPPTPVDAEDMPPALLKAVGSRTHLLNLHLEGTITAAAKTACNALMDELIFQHDAVIHDVQQDTLETKDGTKPLPAAPPKPKPKPLLMSFIFNCRPGERDALRARFLDAVERVAPKAMPRRFGSYEPMPYTLQEDGRDVLLAEWDFFEDFFFWRGSAPYQQGYTMMPDPFSRHPNDVGKFAACCIRLEVSPRVLKTKKDKADMLALFAALSVALDVFYAEISTAGIYGDWRGVPENDPLAQCIGQTYAAIWPAFCDGAQAIEGSHWVRDTVSAVHDMPTPPKGVLAPKTSPQEGRDVPAIYAPQFPFEVFELPENLRDYWDKELVLRVATLKRARAFYKGILPALGGGTLSVDGPFVGFWWEHQSFRLDKAKAPITPQHVLFRAKSQRRVPEFYDLALSLGASAVSAPAMRPERGDWYYACEVTDPDGHLVEYAFRG